MRIREDYIDVIIYFSKSQLLLLEEQQKHIEFLIVEIPKMIEFLLMACELLEEMRYIEPITKYSEYILEKLELLLEFIIEINASLKEEIIPKNMCNTVADLMWKYWNEMANTLKMLLKFDTIHNDLIILMHTYIMTQLEPNEELPPIYFEILKYHTILKNIINSFTNGRDLLNDASKLFKGFCDKLSVFPNVSENPEKMANEIINKATVIGG